MSRNQKKNSVNNFISLLSILQVANILPIYQEKIFSQSILQVERSADVRGLSYSKQYLVLKLFVLFEKQN